MPIALPTTAAGVLHCQCHTRKRVVRGFLSACAGGRANAAHSRPVNSLPSLRPLIARESHVTSAKRLDSAGRDTALGRSSAETTLLDREKSTLSGVVAASPEMQAEVERSQLNLVILCAAVALICAVDRAAMSVAILPMTEAFGWTDSEKGAVASAFFFGYTATNPIAGTLASRGQAKAILSAGVVTWSIFTILTPTAANSGALAILLTCRLIMGCGEGVTFPTIQAMMAKWIPRSSRSRALASTYAGAQAGTIVSLVTAPAIITNFGWPAVFWIYGAVGFVWLAAWQPLVKDEPPVRIEGTQKPGGAPLALKDLPWKKIAGNGPFWALLVSHMTWAVGHYVILAWLPTFYSQQYGLNTADSAAYSILPWVCTFFCTNLGGWTADALINRGVLDVTQTRKLMNSIAFLAPAAALVGLSAAQSDTPQVALAFMTASLALGGFSGAGFASNHQDISSRVAPLLFGITNGSASIAGTTAVYLTGLLRDGGSTWDDIWVLVAGIYALGAAVYIAFGSGEKQFD